MMFDRSFGKPNDFEFFDDIVCICDALKDKKIVEGVDQLLQNQEEGIGARITRDVTQLLKDYVQVIEIGNNLQQ